MPDPILSRILLVEDDPDIQTVARLSLSGIGGFTVEVCGSGPEAIAVAPRFRPQLILLDVMMPGMDGPTTLKALRELPETASTPVVFLTARAQPHEIEELKRAGSAGVIGKPFEPSSLPETLSDIWRRFHGDADRQKPDFEALRREYLAQVPEKLRAIREAADEAESVGYPREAVEDLLHKVHRMVGSAALFGLGTVSDAARELEETVGIVFKSAGRPDEERRRELSRLVQKLEQAWLQSSPPEEPRRDGEQASVRGIPQ